jgi:cytochrome c oxidase subunit 2
MEHALPWFPEEASTVARHVDLLFLFLIGVSICFAGLIFGLIAWFAVKYRSRPGHLRAEATRTHIGLEVAWTVIPLLLTSVMFVWGAKLFFGVYNPPPDAMQIFVVGKQWMWKFQHAEGQREINELHVPIGKPVRLTMISEDVIHDLFVPAFRVKMDVLPGRYTTMWFQATRVGAYHLFCSQYCGTEHSKMGGWVYVMSPVDYQKWLSGGATLEPLAVAGGRLFERLGCMACHQANDSGRGPTLIGLYGKRVKLQTGETVLADEAYLRESILKPNAKIVAGYQPLMPTFDGLVSEEAMVQLVSYIKSLSPLQGAEETENKP